MTAFYRFAYILVRAILKLSGWRVLGKENIPQDEPYIIIANHREYYDPVLVGCTFPRQVHFLYKSEFEKNSFASYLFKLCGAIPLKRDEADISAMKSALDFLKKGDAVGIFPEGARNKGEELMEFKQGGAFMAYRAGVKIIPVGIVNSCNTFRFWKRDVVVMIGRPLEIKADKHNLRLAMENYNQLVRDQVAELIQKAQETLK